MRLRTLFFFGFAAVSLPAAGWSVWGGRQAWIARANAVTAMDAAEAMSEAMRASTAIAVETGQLVEATLANAPNRSALRRGAAATDQALADTRDRLARVGLLVADLDAAQQTIRQARRHVSDALRQPAGQRASRLPADLLATRHALIARLQKVIERIEIRAMRSDPAVGAIAQIGSLAMEMQEYAGTRSIVLTPWIGGRPYATADVVTAAALSGRVAQSWDRVQRAIDQIGESARLRAARDTAQSRFFDRAEPIYAGLVAAALSRSAWPMTFAEYRRWTVSALAELVPLRNALMAEAVARGRAEEAEATRRLISAAALALCTIVLALGAFVALLRRIVTPTGEMTAAITRLARGELSLALPRTEGADEIGAVAEAVEVFRENAVELRRTNLRFNAALENMSQGLAMYDAEERLAVVNTRLCQTVGVPPGSLRPGMTLREVLAVGIASGHFAGRDLDELYAERRKMMSPGDAATFEEIRAGRVLSVMSRPMDGGGCLLTVEDVTERRRAEAQVAHMAHHDALTGLPNRILFRQRLAEALARAQRGEGCAVLCLDLDHFKAANDTLGHAAGDALLRAVTARLRAELRETDTVARLGGDEFVVLQASVNHPDEATALAQRLVDVLGKPYEIEGHQVVIGASVGIALAPANGLGADALLKYADLALYRAKADGRGAWRFFEPEMDAHMQARHMLELDLRRALAAGEFELFFQPVVDSHTRHPVGFEALLRWRHPARGLLLAAEFVPLAEEIGLIIPIGGWALRRACAEAASWPGHLKVAVNLSAAQFRAGNRLVAQVAEALRSSGLPPGRLELEVTESAMLQDSEETLAVLHQLRDLGVAILLDDFGTGYLSLGYLRRFPFDKMKIDRSFIRYLAEDRDCAAIVHAVAGLCAGLGMTTVAEGVETEEQLQRLTAEGCAEVQGFLFSHPIPAEEVQQLLERSPVGVAAEPA